MLYDYLCYMTYAIRSYAICPDDMPTPIKPSLNILGFYIVGCVHVRTYPETSIPYCSGPISVRQLP